MTQSRITFGMIVLNGQPYLRYNLRALYSHAHHTVVVERACRAAAALSRADGHSGDGTSEALFEFVAGEDPDGKVEVVTAQDEAYLDGFWPEKDEMSQAYARRATGTFLWQLDVDESCRDEDLDATKNLLDGPSRVTFAAFRQKAFWGGLDCRTDGMVLRRGARDFYRLFAWGPGYSYVTHRPPTVLDGLGRDTRDDRCLTAPCKMSSGSTRTFSMFFPVEGQLRGDRIQARWADRELQRRSDQSDGQPRFTRPKCGMMSSLRRTRAGAARFCGTSATARRA